ncbi:MAG TPA: ATP-binding protein [Steroidobacteraceae bacterium]|nr:ATP-binding protein [Steroidobacteraceae bacterium]
MRDSRVKALLFLTIFVMTVLPLAAAFYFLDGALQTSLDLGFNRQIVQMLDNESRNLKTLKNIDAQNQERYREQFNQVEELHHVYANPELVKTSVRKSLTIYFALGLMGAVLMSIVVASLLSRRIARAYNTTFTELHRQRERVRYLEEISSWQELAKMLAHEIKNPLTPIEVLVTSLSKAYLPKPQNEFQAQLGQTTIMINEELAHLKTTVNKFSEFAKLPAVQLTEVNLVEILRQQIDAIATSFAAASIQLEVAETGEKLRAKLDTTLFRQVLTNIVRNGVEANPGRRVNFKIRLTVDDSIILAISNDGVPVPIDIAPRIFDPYVSSKSGNDNMGLGLAIVRKIMIEHGGDISYTTLDERPTFTISLPNF